MGLAAARHWFNRLVKQPGEAAARRRRPRRALFHRFN
jgi:hypothetical protein